MNLGKFVFAQVIEHLPLHAFHRCVLRYSASTSSSGSLVSISTSAWPSRS